jgi:hypothetical protein
MMVSVAMLAFIVVGLTAMFVQVQKAFKSGIKQTTITDAGRTVIDMMADDFSQMTDPHFTNNYFPLSKSIGSPAAMYWQIVPQLSFNQNILSNGVPILRTNITEDIFGTIQTNNSWLGIGYSVSNWFTNAGGGAFPGIGTLYRFTDTNIGPLSGTNQLYTNFINQVSFNIYNTNYFHRIADGVVELKVTAYDADGNEMFYESNFDAQTSTLTNLQYPYLSLNPFNPNLVVTNYLPHSIDIELAILEPEALEHARAMYASGALSAAANYLTNAAGQVEIFRQHVLIPAAP